MASKGSSQKNRVADPNKTKNGKTRLGPLNIQQLETMLEKTARPKEKSKIINRLRQLKSRPGYVKPVEAIVEAIVENLEAQPQ
jgi:hypothetical protein